MTRATLHVPKSATEVDRLLAGGADGALLLAGGTDLLVQRRAGRAVATMIDLTNVTDGPPPVAQQGAHTLRLSAITPISVIDDHLGTALPGIRAAIAAFASPQIRHRATIGGNLGTASPSGDLMPPLIVCDAVVQLRGSTGRRKVPLDRFLLGPRQTGLAPGEWIEAVDVSDAPPDPGADVLHGFRKIGARAALTISVVNLAWSASLMPNGTLRAVRLAVGAAAPTVVRCRRAEAALEGRTPAAGLGEAVAAIAADLQPIDDVRGSAGYRRRAAGGLLAEMLTAALVRNSNDYLRKDHP